MAVPARAVRVRCRIARAIRARSRRPGTHHEKLDGSGYPWGLDRQQLSQPARILVVSDIYEALTAVRPYRDALDPEQALAIMAREAGTRLCSDSFGALGSSAFLDDLKPGQPDRSVVPG